MAIEIIYVGAQYISHCVSQVAVDHQRGRELSSDKNEIEDFKQFQHRNGSFFYWLRRAGNTNVPRGKGVKMRADAFIGNWGVTRNFRQFKVQPSASQTDSLAILLTQMINNFFYKCL